MIRHLVLTLALVAYANAHALMSEPPQRGILGGSSKFTPGLKRIPGAPKDFWAHFPAGNKDERPGAGKLSQEREANWKWSMYEPMRPGFKFRAGVCGDLRSKPEHLRGGKYYFGGRITRTYQQGGVIKVRQAVVAHHNGYTQLHVCDVKKCGGEISENCFRQGHCYPLKRAPNPVCDRGQSKNCAPIDRKHPTRWYLPCSSQINDQGWDDYQGQFALFKLPDFLSCEHCVIQWFYTSANNCNPPGVVEYFKGPDGPKNWGKCRGQGGALGGFTQVQNRCGEGPIKDQFPEEYYQCADVRISSSGRSGPPSPSTRAPPTRPRATKPRTTKRPPTNKPSSQNNRSGLFKNFKLVADGSVVKTFKNSLTLNIRRYRKVALEVITSRSVRPVDFYINGKKVWGENNAPYFLYGNTARSPNYFNDQRLRAIINRTIRLEVRHKGDRLTATVRLTR